MTGPISAPQFSADPSAMQRFATQVRDSVNSLTAAKSKSVLGPAWYRNSAYASGVVQGLVGQFDQTTGGAATGLWQAMMPASGSIIGLGLVRTAGDTRTTTVAMSVLSDGGVLVPRQVVLVAGSQAGYAQVEPKPFDAGAVLSMEFLPSGAGAYVLSGTILIQLDR